MHSQNSIALITGCFASSTSQERKDEEDHGDDSIRDIVAVVARP
jgi:hypothetical protein